MTGDELFRTTLPPGRHKLPRDFVQRHQRARLFAAIVELVDEQGYPATSLTQIVKKAGVARHTFYELYEDKDALFLAVFKAGSEHLADISTKAATAGEGTFQERLAMRMSAVLAEIAKGPAMARACLTEALSASPATLAEYERVTQEFAALLRAGGRAAAPPEAQFPASLEEILVGGVVWMVSSRLSTDADSIEELLADVVEFLIAPYLGEKVAREAAESAREAGSAPPVTVRPETGDDPGDLG